MRRERNARPREAAPSDYPWPVTSLVNHLTEDLLASNTYESLSTTVGIVAVLLLMALLLVKEIVRASSLRSNRTMRILDVAIVPMMQAAGVIIIARLAQLL